ncbi:NAD-dependent epimerase/dehydratase family protein [Campylobacter sp. RM16190]|uniref:NAD-dependent epimerase/dehydratase family protein n=1 Tax=Campylobacter sp. RM16190 TaxID=1705727 RepID=UPI00147637DC|nr:NAD-dependent epimerase/dehydratase family protein [Campylobacter sp. RM16190]
MSSKVFITGADGFTGFYLSHYLEKSGYEVIKASIKKQKEGFVYCDICNKESIKIALNHINPEFVIHLAAISFAPSDPDLIDKVNVGGSENLLECLEMLEKKPKRVILASSASVYGAQNSEILAENLEPNPISSYAKSKFKMEQTALKSSLDIIITRPFNYTGAGQAISFLIPKIASHFKEKRDAIELGNLTPKREYNSVLDVVKIYEKLLHAKSKHKIFNIGSGFGYSVGDIVELMKKISGHDIEILQTSKFIRNDEPEILLADISRLKELKIDLCRSDIKEILKWMYEN